MKHFNIILLFLILIVLPVNMINAQPLNVLDCLDDEEDCLELDVNEDEESNEADLLEVDQFESGSVILNIVKMIFALFLVLVLIYVVVKLLSSRQKLNNRVRSLENLGGISVGHNKSIQIIRVGHTFYLIGVGENVELLQEITDKEVIETLLREESKEDDTPINSLLASLFPNKNRSEEKSSSDFKYKFEEELNKIKHHRKTLINKHTEKEDGHD